MTKSEIIRRADDLIIGRNATRNKQIVIAKLVDGLKYEDIAEKFELTVRQIQNIVKKWEKIISE